MTLSKEGADSVTEVFRKVASGELTAEQGAVTLERLRPKPLLNPGVFYGAALLFGIPLGTLGLRLGSHMGQIVGSLLGIATAFALSIYLQRKMP